MTPLAPDDMARNVCEGAHSSALPRSSARSGSAIRLSLSPLVPPSPLLARPPAVTHSAVAHAGNRACNPPLTYPRYRQLRMSVRLMSLISTNVWTAVSRSGATKNGPRPRSCNAVASQQRRRRRRDLSYGRVLRRPRGD